MTYLSHGNLRMCTGLCALPRVIDLFPVRSTLVSRVCLIYLTGRGFASWSQVPSNRKVAVEGVRDLDELIANIVGQLGLDAGGSYFLNAEKDAPPLTSLGQLKAKAKLLIWPVRRRHVSLMNL
jgi:hypothetical protein